MLQSIESSNSNILSAIPVCDSGNILHENPGIHWLYVIDNAIEYLPDHTKHSRLTYETVVHQYQTQRQLCKYRHKTAVELKLRRPTVDDT